MAIYGIDGLEIGNIYALDGSELRQAYDISGNELNIERPAYDIENVVSYYRELTQQMSETISELSSDWDNSVFITDPHGSANKQHSQAIALYLYANTPNISRIILNGDFVNSNWHSSEYTNYMTPFLESDFFEKIFVTIGNHEVGGEATVYDDFLIGRTGLIGNLQSGYYYFDIPAKKLRMMFINTSTNGPLTIAQTQLSWIAQNVILPDSTWHLAVFGHVNVDNLNGVTTQNLNNASALISAITACNGNIVGYFCGHQHIDDIRLTSGGFRQVTLLCDRFENTNYYDGISVTNRVADTVTEQAVSIISINTKNKSVVVRRIGAGWENIVSGLHYDY